MTINAGFVWIIALVFVVLKLTETITWSWWWVLSPLWIGYGLAMAALFAMFMFIRRH